MSWLRIWAIASNGFRAAIRDRILYAVGFYGLLMVVAIRLLPEFAASLEDAMLADWGLGAMGLLGAIVAIFIGTTLISKEVEQRTLLVLLPKPLSRAELILGKHLGLWSVLGVMLVMMTILYWLTLLVASAPLQLAGTAIATLYLWLELALLIAIALFFGTLTQGALAMLLCIGVYGIGHLNAEWVELARLSESPGMQRLLHSFYVVLPDLSRLNWRNDVVFGALPSGGEFAIDLVYALGYTTFLLVLTIVLFARRQF